MFCRREHEISCGRRLHISVLSGAGDNVGIDFLLAPETDAYMSYIRPMYGTQISVHGTEEFAEFTNNNFIAQPGYDFTITIMPSVLVTEAKVRSLALKQRQCLFDDEVRRIQNLNLIQGNVV